MRGLTVLTILILSSAAVAAPTTLKYAGTSTDGKPCELVVSENGGKIASISVSGRPDHHGLFDYIPDSLVIDFDENKVPEGFDAKSVEFTSNLLKSTDYNAVLTPKAGIFGPVDLGGKIYEAALRAVFKQILSFKISGTLGADTLKSARGTSIIVPINEVTVVCNGLRKI